MTDQASTASFLNPRTERWLTALIILGTVALTFVVVDYVANLIMFFGDVIMVFFLAWLLAFMLSPIASGLLHLFPRLPKALAVILVYSFLIIILVAALVLLAQQLYGSINTLLTNWPTPDRLNEILAPTQERLNSLGLSQIHVAEQTNNIMVTLRNGADQLAKPIGDIAIASLGVMGNLLFVFFLSLFMAVDRDRIVSFLFRLVPPAYTDEAKLLERSVSKSFGGFLRGQAVMGLSYAAVSMAASLVGGLPYVPVTATSSGILQAVPFFGPFISWLPPVLVAVFFKPDAVVPVVILMVAGWFVLMNIVQPRLMAGAVGLHPVVVFGSVLIGTRLAGIPGAVFCVPVAAVIASFFFFYLGQSRVDGGSVTERAARRVEEREGRPVRVPRLPQAGEDEEVEPVAGSGASPDASPDASPSASPDASPDASPSEEPSPAEAAVGASPKRVRRRKPSAAADQTP
jgi:predicted PurR-regulated permease PerM